MSNKFKNRTDKSRPKRKMTRKVVVFCEGNTEYNYIDSAKQYVNVELIVSAENMHGGGYNNFLNVIKKRAYDNCLMKFVIVDGDRISNDISEEEAFWKLVKYCQAENYKSTNGACPYILIVNSPKFEYVACMHNQSYKGQNIDSFIKEVLGYKSLDEFKNDKKIYEKLNSNSNSYENVLKYINHHREYIVKNIYHKVPLPEFIKFDKYIINKDNVGKKCTNMNDFYDIVMIR